MGSAAVVLGAWLGLAPEAGVVGEPEPPSAVPELASPAADAVTLLWNTPPECPDEGALRRALAGYLGEEASVEAGAGVWAEAVVTASDDGLRLSLRTETASGVTTRETVAEDCAVLVDATALIVAIAVDPSGVIGRSEQLRGADSPPPEPATPDPPAPAALDSELESLEPVAPPEREAAGSDAPEPEPAPRPDPRRRFGMRIGGGIDGGTLPALAGGLRLTGSMLGPRWRAELHGGYWFPREARAQSGVGGRVALWTVGARGCGVLGVEAIGLEIPACAGLEAGVLRGDPSGDRVVAPETSRRPWLAATGRAGLVWAPRRFIALHVAAELVVPVLRSGFRVGDVEIHRVGAVAGRGLVAVEARFP